jgi:hypothetical protein
VRKHRRPPPWLPCVPARPGLQPDAHRDKGSLARLRYGCQTIGQVTQPGQRTHGAPCGSGSLAARDRAWASPGSWSVKVTMTPLRARKRQQAAIQPAPGVPPPGCGPTQKLPSRYGSGPTGYIPQNVLRRVPSAWLARRPRCCPDALPPRFESPLPCPAIPDCPEHLTKNQGVIQAGKLALTVG